MMATLLGILQYNDVRFAKRGGNINVDKDLLFRLATSVQTPVPWIQGAVYVKRNQTVNIGLGKSFVGIPLFFVEKLMVGGSNTATKAECPANPWTAFVKAGSNKLSIRNESSPSTFSYLVMDARAA